MFPRRLFPAAMFDAWMFPGASSLRPAFGGGPFPRSMFPMGMFMPRLFPGSRQAAGTVAANIGVVLGALRVLLVRAGIATDAAAAVTLEPQPFPTTAGPQVLIQPGGFAPDDPLAAGAGRAATLMVGTATVLLADRAARDKAGRDTYRVADAGDGLLALAHRAAAVLQEEFLAADDGAPLTVEPLMVQGQPQPYRFKDPTWAGQALTVRLSYLEPLSVPA